MILLAFFIIWILTLRSSRAACPEGSALRSLTIAKDANSWSPYIGPADAFAPADLSFNMPASDDQIDPKKVLEANTCIVKNPLPFRPVNDTPLKLTTKFALECKPDEKGIIGGMIGFLGKDFNWFFQVTAGGGKTANMVFATQGPDWHQGLNGNFEAGLASDVCIRSCCKISLILCHLAAWTTSRLILLHGRSQSSRRHLRRR